MHLNPLGNSRYKYSMIIAIKTYEIIPNIALDRKSTRLNSSHANISYAVFCLKKKKKTKQKNKQNKQTKKKKKNQTKQPKHTESLSYNSNPKYNT